MSFLKTNVYHNSSESFNCFLLSCENNHRVKILSPNMDKMYLHPCPPDISVNDVENGRGPVQGSRSSCSGCYRWKVVPDLCRETGCSPVG